MHKEFAVHRLNAVGMESAKRMASLFDSLLTELETSCRCNIGTREFSLAKTKLEEAAFFAKKAMAIDPTNQEQ